jgi:arginine decarboxylase
MLQQADHAWTPQDSAELYEVSRWANGYFSVSDAGHVQAHPGAQLSESIDLKDLVDRLQQRGLGLPILLRFNGMLEHRIGEIQGAFQRAIDEHDYLPVYPIKVNQQRHVVEQIARDGRSFPVGLEAGSKPELLAVLAVASEQTPIICNGFKDGEFIETVILAHKLGRRITTVVEKYTELELILKYAAKHDVRPRIGIRVKLASRGSGRWQASGGSRSKFGLTVSEVVRATEFLRQEGLIECFELLHFHLGSQITNIRHIKNGLLEAARIYAFLSLRGAGLTTLDVGGGLGVDYDGSQTDVASSVNYTLQEYANDVIYHVQDVCDDAGVAHPTIVSESGRAIAAYHSVLIFNALGVASKGRSAAPSSHPMNDETPQPLRTLQMTHDHVEESNLLESYHDAQQALEMAINLFGVGHLSLEERARAEDLFSSICHRIHGLAEQLEFVPEELQKLNQLLSDTYFFNFSIFQSIPDSWAIEQLFPVMPIHRLAEKPTRHAELGDITCDSDGKIDRFVNRRDVKRTLELHAWNEEPYYLGAFLVGAYQEILGDLHNLFGDTHAVHVTLDERGDVVVQSVVKGDTIGEVLGYVQFNQEYLQERIQAAVEVAVRRGNLGQSEAGLFLKYYEDGLNGYTYLEAAPD